MSKDLSSSENKPNWILNTICFAVAFIAVIGSFILWGMRDPDSPYVRLIDLLLDTRVLLTEFAVFFVIPLILFCQGKLSSRLRNAAGSSVLGSMVGVAATPVAFVAVIFALLQTKGCC